MLKFEVSTRGLVLLVLSLIAIWTFLELWPVILLVVTSVILMVGLLPFVEALVQRGMSRGLAVTVIFLAIFGVVVGLLSLMVPALIAELTDVRENLPASAHELEQLLGNLGINIELEERARNIDWNGLISGRAAVETGQRVLTTTVSIITIIVMAAYLLADTPRLARFINQFIPNDRQADADRLFLAISGVVGGYLRGQLVTSLCIAGFTFIVLSVVGAPNPLAFAVLAGFADVIPLIGAFIAIIPPTAAALQESSTRAVIVLATLLAYQQFEDRYLVPRVYGRTLNLPPIIVLIAVLAGAELLGVTGVLLALPLTAAGRVLLDYWMANGSLVHLPEATDIPVAPDPSPAEKRRIRRRTLLPTRRMAKAAAERRKARARA